MKFSKKLLLELRAEVQLLGMDLETAKCFWTCKKVYKIKILKKTRITLNDRGGIMMCYWGEKGRIGKGDVEFVVSGAEQSSLGAWIMQKALSERRRIS